MLTAAERSILRRKLEQYEGRVPHMYLDTDGNVTVGVGHLLATVEAARELPFRTASQRKATPQRVSEEFREIAAQPKGYTASWYGGFTDLVLSNADIDRLTERHIDSFHRELRVIYPGVRQISIDSAAGAVRHDLQSGRDPAQDDVSEDE